MIQIFANNATATLAAAIASTDTTLALATGQGTRFPSPSNGDYAVLTLTQFGSAETSWEEVYLTARSVDTLTVTRGREGSTAAAWAAGDKVELRITAGFLNNVGYSNLPQNVQSAAYTCVLADQGRHILHPVSDVNARVFTIPTNANVPYPIGTVLTFVNLATSTNVTISYATGVTLLFPGSSGTGSRTLGRNGIATALKVDTDKWLLSGAGLS